MDLNKIISQTIRKTLTESYSEKGMEVIGNVKVSDELKYHLDNNLNLRENAFR